LWANGLELGVSWQHQQSLKISNSSFIEYRDKMINH
jgi:hypothetical protein